VGPGFSPLDEELGLLSGALTPRLHETLVRLSTTQPSFAKASAELAWHTGTTVHADTARRRTEAAGAVLVAHETAEAARILREHPDSPPGPDTLIFSVDGAMVPVLGGQWKEVRTLAVGEVQPPRPGSEGPVIQTTTLSYFSRLTDSHTFAELALPELQRRGIERAGRVGAVVDGADWCQTFVDYHYPEARRILDLSHAAEHLTAIGQTVGPEGPLLTPAAQQRLRDDLREKGPAGVLAELRPLVAACSPDADVQTHLAYLDTRQAQLQYPQFVAEGWPIGSGMVESANKLVVEDRLKGAGMHWEEANVNPMLALRNAYCNERWAEAWSVIEQGLRRQVVVQRQARRNQHRVVPPPAPAPLPSRPEAIPPPPPADPPPLPEPVAEAIASTPEAKPTHPWKRAWSVRRQRELAGAA
jgi:hypothetical protein